MNCVLCNSSSDLFFKDETTQQIYFHCNTCNLHFLAPKQRLTRDSEKSRYDLHENNISDIRYHNFLKPMADLVIKNIAINSHGLDFGCGPGPKLSMMLEFSGYKMTIFDPFYYPDRNCFQRTYDFVVMTEVAEHLHSPYQEFRQIRKILKPYGGLGIMTSLYTDQINFKNWHYRRDPTHVCFYSAKTIEWLGRAFGFKSCHIENNNLIWLN